MSANSQDQEIDLGQIFKKLGSIFQSFIDSIFDFILFTKKNIIILVILFIIGAGIGLYFDKTSKIYNHEIIVSPNFGSVDYLYSKIALLSAKKNEKDYAFLSKLGFNHSNEIRKIEIEPIIDIYQIINDKENANLDMIKLFAEDGELSKVIEDKVTSKNYPFHRIKITTSAKITDKSLVTPLLNYLNDSEYFSKIKNQSIDNEKITMKINDSIIAQIDDLLNEFSKKTSNSKGNNLVYYNENNQFNDLINTKTNLVANQAKIRLTFIKYEKIIKEIANTLNIIEKEGIHGKLKLMFPFLFIILFLIFKSFSSFYNNQMKKRNLV